jgi:LytS/YehU family sensor histidine kinase
MAAAFRYQLGGIGATVGVVVVLLSALLGVVARQFLLRRGSPPRPMHYLLLGVVVQLMQLAAFTQVPNRSGYAFIEQAVVDTCCCSIRSPPCCSVWSFAITNSN